MVSFGAKEMLPFDFERATNNFLVILFLGIDIDIQLKSGWTSLMLAASTASSDLVELLINRGANVNFHKGISCMKYHLCYCFPVFVNHCN